MSDTMACQHENFAANVEVARLIEHEPTAFHACVTLQCADCNERFVFNGLPEGMDLNRPMMSPFGHEARLPIRPASQEYRDVIAPSFHIRSKA